MSLGAYAGARATTEDGLTRFKRGWTTSSLPVYLCGHVIDPERYQEITVKARAEPAGYFPAYRAEEFTDAGGSCTLGPNPGTTRS